MLLFPEALRPTKIVGLSNSIRAAGMLRKPFNTICRIKGFISCLPRLPGAAGSILQSGRSAHRS